ncbi:protein translocase subunit SecF [Aeromonas schubertii]|uniref:Protein-export membrane protein SecF n=1 Tax=Aeromonas schubertii TaxID=652 RepID=A0A0S2SKX9_9GAMM|nr:protein translocase subunit SecF [Aeromonas schubertii]ALP42380.1 preprotein translocase subunit SecF [Aeromonas schubertii]MBZ6066253.1 protein translocase subunit SecF [Aeromonas schubertii]MBZ6071094.1 protein translocase subunit SecF [Aeromonas schubertii]QCG47435.1 protein translocase subunit SecF [Aeromonas schubertii]
MFQILHFEKPIPFMRFAKPGVIFSLALVVLSMVTLAQKGLNWGLDFTGGTIIEVGFQQTVSLDEVRSALESNQIEGATLQHFGSSQDVLIRLAPKEGIKVDEQGRQVLAAAQTLNPAAALKRVEFVGPSVGAELATDGALAMLASIICILIYVAFRFEWRLAMGGIISLAHDIAITLGIFAWFQIEFDLTVVAALMTVVGYSLNDTIVVFDRLRENFRKIRKGDTAYILDLSMTETLSRTIITSGLTLVVVLALFFKGGPLIHGFATAMLAGVAFGTYSSIYVASAFAMYMGVKREHMLPPQVEKEGADQQEIMP